MNVQATQAYIDKFHEDFNYKAKHFGANVFIGQNNGEDRSLEVLLIEDDISDIDAFKTSMDDSPIPYNVVALNSNREAITYLNREKPYSDMAIPDVIFVDMSSEIIKGERLLDYINGTQVLTHIPVVTAFDDIIDMTTPEGAQYACKISKPFDMNSLVNKLLTIRKLWHIVGYRDNNSQLGYA